VCRFGNEKFFRTSQIDLYPEQKGNKLTNAAMGRSKTGQLVWLSAYCVIISFLRLWNQSKPTCYSVPRFTLYWSQRQEFNFTIVQLGFVAGGQIGNGTDFSWNISPLSWQLYFNQHIRLSSDACTIGRTIKGFSLIPLLQLTKSYILALYKPRRENFIYFRASSEWRTYMCIYMYIVISKELNFCRCSVTMQHAIVVVTGTY
jgi:hypothetical protein